MPPFFWDGWSECEHVFQRAIIIHSFHYILILHFPFQTQKIKYKGPTYKYLSSHLRHILQTKDYNPINPTIAPIILEFHLPSITFDSKLNR